MKDLVDVVERRADLQFKVCLTDEVRVHIVGKLPRDVEHTSRLNRLRGSVILLPRHAKTQSFEFVCGIHRTQLRDQFDLNQLCWERKSGRDHKRASHLRCWRPISFFSDGSSGCERLLHICDVQYFLDHILQGGAEVTENLLCVRITL